MTLRLLLVPAAVAAALTASAGAVAAPMFADGARSGALASIADQLAIPSASALPGGAPLMDSLQQDNVEQHQDASPGDAQQPESEHGCDRHDKARGRGHHKARGKGHHKARDKGQHRRGHPNPKRGHKSEKRGHHGESTTGPPSRAKARGEGRADHSGKRHSGRRPARR